MRTSGSGLPLGPTCPRDCPQPLLAWMGRLRDSAAHPGAPSVSGQLSELLLLAGWGLEALRCPTLSWPLPISHPRFTSRS